MPDRILVQPDQITAIRWTCEACHSAVEIDANWELGTDQANLLKAVNERFAACPACRAPTDDKMRLSVGNLFQALRQSEDWALVVTRAQSGHGPPRPVPVETEEPVEED